MRSDDVNINLVAEESGELVAGLTRVDELLYELRVKDVMTRNLLVVTPDQSMANLRQLLSQNRISGAPVVQDGRLVGVISLEDLICSLASNDLAAPIEAYMATEAITVGADEFVVEALKLFSQTRVGRLPVVDRAGKVVGIVTKGDSARGILRALQTEQHAEEVKRYRVSHLFEDLVSDRTSLVLRYRVQPRDFVNGGKASADIKRTLLRLGIDPKIARRCAIASYEAEMNLVIHTLHGGLMRVEIEPHIIFFETVDDGPGIKDTELARQPGYSTASEEIRALGFGAGFGLKNIERCVDKMWLESGKGTRLETRIYLSTDARYHELNAAFERLGFRSARCDSCTRWME